MDTFFEQIVVKKPSAAETALKVAAAILGGAAVLLLIWLSLTPILGILSFLLFPIAVGLGALLIYLLRNTYVEFEYSITNGSFDIDKIKGKRKRSRMISLECIDFEEFGVYDAAAESRLREREFGGVVFAATRGEDGLFYAVSRHKTLDTVLIVIDPDERIKSALKKFIPRQVQGNVLSGTGSAEN